MPTPLRWTPELIARFWDFESNRHGNYFAEQFGAAIVGSFSDLLPARPTVVDYGCGIGGLLPHLLDRAARVFALDHSPASRVEVKRRFGSHPRLAGVVAPDEAVAAVGSADALFCVEVIEHLDDPALVELLGRARALLKPGGLAIFTTPNREELAASSIYCPSCDHHFHRWQHVRSWEAASLCARLAQHGFSVARTLETDFRDHPRVDRARALRRWLRRLRGKRTRTPHLACAVRRGAS